MSPQQHEISRALARAVIWDVDGTLIDSGPLHFDAWSATLRDQNWALTQEQFLSTFGQRNDAVLRTLLGADLADNEIERISATKERRYRELLMSGAIGPLPGVREWLARLEAAGWRQGLASSAPRENLDAMVEVLGIASYFDAMVSGDDVRHGKPDPEIFMLAASRLNVDPRRCVVVEDAPAGLEGARRARMRSVGVGASHTSLQGDIVVPSLEQLPHDAFERLIPLLP